MHWIHIVSKICISIIVLNLACSNYDLITISPSSILHSFALRNPPSFVQPLVIIVIDFTRSSSLREPILNLYISMAVSYFVVLSCRGQLSTGFTFLENSHICIDWNLAEIEWIWSFHLSKPPTESFSSAGGPDDDASNLTEKFSKSGDSCIVLCRGSTWKALSATGSSSIHLVSEKDWGNFSLVHVVQGIRLEF